MILESARVNRQDSDMKNKAEILLALTLLAAPTTAGFASLWDTFDECVARYGKPIHVSDDVIKMGGDPMPNRFTFKKDSLLIFVWFSDKGDKGRSIREDFLALNGRLEVTPLTDEQIAAILRENAGGSSWSIWQLRHVPPDEETAGEYRRADGHGFAEVTGSTISLLGHSYEEIAKAARESFQKKP